MKKYILGVLMFASIWACSKEDWPDNSAPERNWLAPEEGATDEISVLRREFHDRNGIYLLFSDTLGIRENKTLTGETVYDYQILGYDMTTPAWSQDSFSYQYYTNHDKRKKAVEFVEDCILPNISNLFWPNAVLLLDRLEYFKYVMIDENWDWFEDYVFLNLTCQNKLQAMVFGIGDVTEKTEEEKEAMKNEILQVMVSEKVSLLPAKDMELFYSYSNEWYNVNGYVITDAGYTFEELGLLAKLEDNGSISSTSKEYDLAAFIERIFAISKDEFYAQFQSSPLIIRKMEALVSVLQKYGVNIYTEE